ncbi:MAG: DNA-damage-inducible protein J [Candidatus Peregrinibacteria bacterium Greene0416_62]|nr:MAG: DNA-damage-inducible protein J [Candidatus Peregrinibacteria bacterium Greene0416_62]TSD00751.1 MAG: DNA-damage-inducible protein J [Candidatus Peregrinibacteria bacterium Greene1014_49]
MASKSIQVRLDERLKKRVEKIFADIGVDTPTAVRMFFMKVAATGEIPFSLQAHQEDHYTPRQLKALDRLAAKAMKEKLAGPFTTVEALLEDLHR